VSSRERSGLISIPRIGDRFNEIFDKASFMSALYIRIVIYTWIARARVSKRTFRINDAARIDDRLTAIFDKGASFRHLPPRRRNCTYLSRGRMDSRRIGDGIPLDVVNVNVAEFRNCARRICTKHVIIPSNIS